MFTGKSRKEEALYHPRLTYIEPEEEDESEADSYDQQSERSYSPRRSSGGSSGEESSPRRRPGPKKFNSVSPTSRKPERRHERMFDDSDDDSSNEKEGTNLNWTPAEVTPTPSLGTARRRTGPPGNKEPPSAATSGLINLCANVPPAPGAGAAVPEARPAAAPMSHAPQQGQTLFSKVYGG